MRTQTFLIYLIDIFRDKVASPQFKKNWVAKMRIEVDLSSVPFKWFWLLSLTIPRQFLSTMLCIVHIIKFSFGYMVISLVLFVLIRRSLLMLFATWQESVTMEVVSQTTGTAGPWAQLFPSSTPPRSLTTLITSLTLVDCITHHQKEM